jgi:glucose-1-phosphate adenylyltransferase
LFPWLEGMGRESVMQDVLTLILGGGRGVPLYPLTRHRSEPAVPLAGKYRLIDVPISNCLNSGIQQIFVLTQFLSVSLHRHLAQTFKVEMFSRGFVEVLHAQQTNEGSDWYQGTADAVRQHLDYLSGFSVEHVLILYADQLYRMDFQDLMTRHAESRADITVAVLPVNRERSHRVGLLRVDADDSLVAISEKPHTEATLDRMRVGRDYFDRNGRESLGRDYLANMGIYLFRRDALLDLMRTHAAATDLVFDILAPALATHRVRAYLFDGYWEDLGTIPSYFHAHLALLDEHPPFDFSSSDGIIYTRMRNLPASRVSASRVERCLIADGCTVGQGADLSQSVVGVRSRVGANVRLRQTIMIGADGYESAEQEEENSRQGIPNIGIGDGAVIERAILDKDCRIGRGARIVNARGVRNEECEKYVIRDGIVVIPNGTVIPDGTVI